MTDTMGTQDARWVEPVIPDSAFDGAIDEGDSFDDLDLGGDEASPVEEAPAEHGSAGAAPEETGAADPPQPPVSEPRGYDDPAALIEKLRNENAEHRIAKQAYEKAFEGYDPQSREAMLDIARLMVSDPAAAAARMEQIASNIRSQPQYAPSDEPMTRADFDRMLAERDRAFQAQQEQQQQNALASQVFQKLEGWGMKPESFEAQQLILAAMLNHNNDLDAAKAALAAKEEAAAKAAVDAYLAKRRQDAKGPRPENGGGAAPNPNGGGTYKTIEEAARAAMASADIT